MTFSQAMLENGENLQLILFFGALATLGLGERLVPRRPGALGRRERWPTNWGLTLLSVLSLPLVPVSLIGASLWAESQGVGVLNGVTLPTWAVVSLTLLARGLLSTGTHWLNHKIPWLWRIHRVHHLDTDLDVSSTVRFHPLEFFVGAFVGAPFVIVLGLPAWVLLFYELLDVTVTIFSHSNLRLPVGLDRWLRYIIVTPDLHRVHHSTQPAETDSNFGAVFPIWDLALGTFRTIPPERQPDMELGLRELRGREAHGVLRLLLSPFRSRLRRDERSPLEAAPVQP